MRRLGSGLVALVLASSPVSGQARAGEQPFLLDRTARAHYDLAGEHAARGDLRSAAAELDAAHAIEPHPELLFVRAEVRRKLGECRTAVILYREFVASAPSEAATRQAEDGITACEQSLGPREPETTPEPAPAPVVREPPPVQPAPRERPWQRDPAGGVLLGFGVASLATTIGLAVCAGIATRQAAESSEAMYAERRSIAVGFQAGTGAAAALGASLVLGAALRYRAVKRRSRLGAWFDGHGGGVAWSGRF